MRGDRVAWCVMNLTTKNEVHALMESAPTFAILDGFQKAVSVLSKEQYQNIAVSISGGSDSDVVMDIIERVRKCVPDKKITYVWFDTGLEYKATKQHLLYLEEKYGVTIQRHKAAKPIPTTVRKIGVPFLSKQVSEFISRLQSINFEWDEETSFDVLWNKYRAQKSALKWWCNANGKSSRFNINYNKWLREFLIANPPTFRIANKCCYYAKKTVSHQLIKTYGFDLMIVGVRRAEGGARVRIPSCFSSNPKSADSYRPIFWYKNADKKAYDYKFDISHSDCYTKYGLPRTGCCGCPCARGFEQELEIIKKYEPNMYKLCKNIFGISYEYTKEYRRFYQRMENKKILNDTYQQMSIFDYLK
ncbi:Phosphoadenosine phosphosulfate reductase family protein [Lachnospiraceae bacterium KHCPX20]|nr:Phosphoadenosine phosphosulfate reductase family protein [Lachnospiraceae bacterium KHCPX20]